jgi:hypothetical protein
MSLSQNLSKSLNLQGLPSVVGRPAPETALLPALAPRPWKEPAAITPSPALASAKCFEKGCVFPAAPGTAGRCRQHERQAREPILFSSHQPTRVVLERGRFEMVEGEHEVFRSRDRRQLAAIREAFLED